METDRTFFITTVTVQRLRIFGCGAAAELLVETLAHYRDQRKYLLHEFVVMPDHLHLLLTPAPEVSLQRAVQFIKEGFSFRLRAEGRAWQAGFSGEWVRELEDYCRHRDYIWMNPVRAGLAGRPEAYPYGSATGRLRLDLVPPGLRVGAAEAA